MGLMGGPGFFGLWGGLLCDASFFCCCARLRGRADAWGRGVGGIRARKKGTIAFHRRRPIDADFLWLPPRTPGTIEASERALSAAPTASAKAPRSALA